MSGNINENTFVSLTYNELSQEGFGLPSIRNLRAPSEKELFNSPIVKAAALKAKAYGTKKGYTNDIPVSEKEKEAYIKAILFKRSLTIMPSEVKSISKNVAFVKVNGVVIVKCKCLLTTADMATLGFIASAVGAAMGFAIEGLIAPGVVSLGIKTALTTGSIAAGKTVAVGSAAVQSGLLGFIGGKFLEFISKKFIEKNKRNNISIFASWVAFKNNKNKVVLKRFCNGLIDPNMYVPGKEDLTVSDETDEVSMTDLVENETTVEEDAGKDSEVTDINIPQDDSAHNEEASSGGVVTPDNKDDLEVKPTETDTNSIEAWYDDPAYSLEETGEDGVRMQCLVEDETTTEEDAGKDSEVKDAKPTEAETEHNEEASAGGVLTGDNKDELEVKETSEEALGITDYDLYSEDQYKSLEGIFDPDDLK